jgi:tetratricopeptide (TPR) repeat protein
MSFLKLFVGKSAEDHERKGDASVASQAWGDAAIAYQRALDKLAKTSPGDETTATRLGGKIAGCREALAKGHRDEAGELIESGAYEEAHELLLLASELSADVELKGQVEGLLEEIERRMDREARAEAPVISYREPEEEPVFEESEEEYFQALVSALPEALQEAYRDYGADFATGYVALNRGEFEAAATHLSRALEQNSDPESYIPLELATAFLNLDRRGEARELLVRFIPRHPDALPAYQLLCEVFWQEGAFDKAEALLAAVPPELTESVAVYLLKGEHLQQSGDHEGAKAFYGRFMQTYGWNESVALALAKVHEAGSEIDAARGLYGEAMKRCTGCGSRVDPLVKEKFADLSFASGQHTTAVLELYLSLAREIPAKAPAYYHKVSRIYETLGNAAEARRFRSLADRLG